MNIDQLSYKHHKNAPYLFKDLSFQLKPGAIHALHGKNGTGKSVLLRLLNGKRTPEAIVEGEIRATGKTLLVDQRYDQLIADAFTFEENLRFACIEPYPSLIKPLKKPIYHANFVEIFSIDTTKLVHTLSGGQRQILALLMVLQKPVTTLLLDEPTATLDEENAVLVFEFLKVVAAQNIAILVVCHDRELIDRYASQAFNLESAVAHGQKCQDFDSQSLTQIPEW